MGRIYEYSLEEQKILFPEKFITSEKKVNTIKEDDDTSRILDIIYDSIVNKNESIIFDISHVSNDKIIEIRDLFKSHQFGYSELSCCEDQIVFAAIDKEMQS